MALEVARCGLVPYARALAWQEALVARRLAGGNDVLLLLEHPPVYTLGRGADARFLGSATDGTVPILRVGRGGQVTYHGPGQLVGYPILGLRDLRPDIRWYVRGLEQVLIDTLGDLGIAAHRRDGLTGVFVESRKIGSIGVGIRRWITWHGFALNVGRDLAATPPSPVQARRRHDDLGGARRRSESVDQVADVAVARSCGSSAVHGSHSPRRDPTGDRV
jgi:lipoyl(octanoyl) transferase